MNIEHEAEREREIFYIRSIVLLSTALNLAEYQTIFNLPRCDLCIYAQERCRGSTKQFIRIYWICSASRFVVALFEIKQKKCIGRKKRPIDPFVHKRKIHKNATENKWMTFLFVWRKHNFQLIFVWKSNGIAALRQTKLQSAKTKRAMQTITLKKKNQIKNAPFFFIFFVILQIILFLSHFLHKIVRWGIMQFTQVTDKLSFDIIFVCHLKLKWEFTTMQFTITITMTLLH